MDTDGDWNQHNGILTAAASQWNCLHTRASVCVFVGECVHTNSTQAGGIGIVSTVSQSDADLMESTRFSVRVYVKRACIAIACNMYK